MRKHATLLLLSFSVIIAELHRAVKDNGKVYNWIINVSVPMSNQWNVWFLCNQVNFILLSLATFLYVSNRLNKTAVLCYLLWQCADLFLYFWNFKADRFYGLLYVVILFIGIIHYRNQSRAK